MTGSVSPTLPVIGQPNSTEDPKVKGSFETIRDALNAVLNSDNTIMGQTMYRNILFGGATAASGIEAATYILANEGNTLIKNETEPAEGVVRVIPIFYFDDADYLITGKTLKMRLRAQVTTNATKPTIKFTFGLYPLTTAGGTKKQKFTLGTVVSGSALEINEPALSTVTQAVTSDFTIPADGAFSLGVVLSGAMTVNSMALLAAQLQVRNV